MPIDPHNNPDHPEDRAPQDSLATGRATPTSRSRTYLTPLLIVAYITAVMTAQGIFAAFGIAIYALIRHPHGGFQTLIATGTRSLTVLTIGQIMTLTATIVVTTAFYGFRQPISKLRITTGRRWADELFFGIALGICLISIMFLVTYLAGWSTSVIVPHPSTTASILRGVIDTLILMAAIAITEEVMMRAYILTKLREAYGPVAALIFSSVIFGSMHFMNPNASFSGFLGTTAAGLMLGYAFLLTNRLWLPIGIHFAWNLAEGSIFGFPVSGINLPSIIHQNYSGPALWTGGRFGPEAGLLSPMVLIIGTLLITIFARSQRQYVKLANPKA